MKNTLTDLNNYLFESLERINDDNMTKEELQIELERSKQVVSVSRTVVENARLILDATKHADEYSYKERGKKMPLLIKENEKN